MWNVDTLGGLERLKNRISSNYFHICGFRTIHNVNAAKYAFKPTQ